MAVTYVDDCIFCKIIKSEAPAENIYEDDEVLCIKDIKPASRHHYLIIPKTHIPNAKSLKAEDEPLYDKLVNTVASVCTQQGINTSSMRTGFHWPPCNSVNHLHLHVIAPVNEMGFVHRLMFKENSFWFVSTDYVKSLFKDAR
ncbi:histidine triad nucleotide-binding protein 3-like [Venturia canescens]|uniref:histidine triad nucleotide-binding protein 3-like n=1 Tax=Venturia canescens TaxID=32260 RepID=UPI001C9BEF6C|nr:histidine triad nucleotide-binding protein 3-like [Venturia canescens]